jgi:hypothetical protein
MPKPEKPALSEEWRRFYRECAELRQRADRPCAVCGEIMPAALLERRYCSVSCRERARRQRQGPEIAARQRAYRERVKQHKTDVGQVPDASAAPGTTPDDRRPR